MEYKFKRTINYYETDKMGIVHHSNYIRFLEEARVFLFREIGMPYEKVEEEGMMIPVLEVNCNYKNHITYADTIIINSKITEFNGVRLSVEYTIVEEKTKKVVMTAKTKHCFTNKNLKPINLKKYNLEYYEKISEIMEKA